MLAVDSYFPFIIIIILTILDIVSYSKYSKESFNIFHSKMFLFQNLIKDKYGIPVYFKILYSVLFITLLVWFLLLFISF